jgi:hypothetical protein
MENEVKEPVSKHNYINMEAYPDLESKSTKKHEYYQAEIFATSGAPINHNRISMNVSALLRTTLEGKAASLLAAI